MGEIVRRGQTLFAIDGEPALLLYGSTDATRAFTAGMSPGADVAELNANLDALGYGHGLTGDAFTPATAAAIRRLQVAHGENATGQLLVGSVVFEPGPIRVTSLESTVAVGAAVTAGPVLSATGTARQVQIQLDPALQGQVRAGDPVTITLPNDQTTPGRITHVSSVATARPEWESTDDRSRRRTDRSGRDRQPRPGARQRVDHDRQREQRARRARRRAAVA